MYFSLPQSGKAFVFACLMVFAGPKAGAHNSDRKFTCLEGPSWFHNIGTLRKYDWWRVLPTKGHLKQNNRGQKPKSKADNLRDLCSGSVVKVPCFLHRGWGVGVGVDSWLGIKVPHATRPKNPDILSSSSLANLLIIPWRD